MQGVTINETKKIDMIDLSIDRQSQSRIYET